ncbi:hypothetical protein RCL1_008577 [Eukaryota sp. TZLM3-RCL]
MQSFNDLADLVSFFQAKAGVSPSFEQFCSILSTFEVSTSAHFSILADFLIFGFVLFSSRKQYIEICKLLRQHKFDQHHSISSLDEDLSPFIIASFALEQGHSNAGTLARKVDSTKSNYAVLALLYQIITNCCSLQAIDFFFLWTPVCTLRLFTGAWRLLFKKLTSTRSLHLILNRLPSLPAFLRSLYAEFFTNFTRFSKPIGFQTLFVDIKMTGNTVFISDKTVDDRSFLCQQLAFNYYVQQYVIHQVVVEALSVKKRFSKKEFQQLIGNGGV